MDNLLDKKFSHRRFSCFDHKANGRSFDKYTLVRTSGNIKWYKCIDCSNKTDEYIKKREIAWNTTVPTKKEMEQILSNEYWSDFFKKQKEREYKVKNELWDCYVLKHILRGEKYIKISDIPKEIIQFQRAIIRLKRLIELKRKENVKSKQHKRS